MIKKLPFVFVFFFTSYLHAQLLTWSPDFITESSTNTVITVDGSKGNGKLLDFNPTDVYVHIGVITNKSTGADGWRYVTSVWGTRNSAFKASPAAGLSRWSFTIAPDLRTYFGITDATEKIQKIAILFRSGDGSLKQANADGSDMYVPVYSNTIAVRITAPPFQPTYKPTPETITKSVGDNLTITAKANKAAVMRILLNGTEIETATGVTSISSNPVFTSAGEQTIIAEANDGGVISRDTLKFFVTGSVNIAPLPAGVKQGINYINNTTATLVLYAPGKGRVAVIGDFPGNNWTEQTTYQMNKTPDGNYWWITLSGLEAGKEYSFQYLVNGNLRIADPYSEKILDPYNDQYISTDTYPNLKPYPNGHTTEVVGILQTAQTPYAWGSQSYSRPDKRNLIIYELLVRDFIDKHDWNTLRDTLTYLKKLGINAIEIMPFNEFEGNISWGYNPDFYFAPDKYYGPAHTLKEFIDSCHANGIAVIMDIALNHSFGMSPMVRLYWDAANNRPAGDNPWFNRAAKHAFNVGYDMNHESPQTKYFVSRVVQHWMSEYKIDGFRFDLSKGFTQKQTCDNNGNNCNVGAWSAYDQSRIDIWKGYYDTLQKYNPGAYCILEHFAENSEEKVLSDYGMMLWGNLNYNYNQASMGWSTDWNFDGGLANVRGWSSPNLITYMESHDEERMMYKNLLYGNSTPTYNIKVLDTALQRQALAAAFFFTLPGPKMIWQFGELGYEYSINYCQNGTVDNNCRTDPKPIRWDYYQDERRLKLFKVYSNLIHLRRNPAFAEAFTSNVSEQNFSGSFKWLKLNSSSGKLVVVGNFDVVNQTGSVSFPTSGTWYNYLTGETFEATGSPQSFELKPGEFKVFTSTYAALPVRLIDFSGVNQGLNNLLSWQVADEKNVKNYEVQRSSIGSDFSTIARVPASGRSDYRFTDDNLSAGSNWYYRLRVVDADGGASYSKVVLIRSSQGAQLRVYPNPFRSVLKLEIEANSSGPGNLVLAGMDGRTLIRKQINLRSGINEILLPETAGLTNGTYVLKLIVQKEESTIKVVKQGK